MAPPLSEVAPDDAEEEDLLVLLLGGSACAATKLSKRARKRTIFMALFH